MALELLARAGYVGLLLLLILLIHFVIVGRISPGYSWPCTS